MKNPCAVGALVTVAVLLSLPVHAQVKAKKEAKPPLSTSQAVLDQWNDIGRKLIAIAEDFPEDKYDFKPTPAQQTFGQRLLHAANVNYFFTNVALGQKPPSMEEADKQQYKTKAEIAAFVKKSFEDGAAAIKQGGDAGMNKLVTDPFSKERERTSDYAYGFIEHSGEIYGQLAVYYRVAGLVPPESRPKK
jgi:uncharacterized damage-inducible protein DinB